MPFAGTKINQKFRYALLAGTMLSIIPQAGLAVETGSAPSTLTTSARTERAIILAQAGGPTGEPPKGVQPKGPPPKGAQTAPPPGPPPGGGQPPAGAGAPPKGPAQGQGTPPPGAQPRQLAVPPGGQPPAGGPH